MKGRMTYESLRKQPENSIMMPIRGLATVEATDVVGDRAETKWPKDTETLPDRTRMTQHRQKRYSDGLSPPIQ